MKTLTTTLAVVVLLLTACKKEPNEEKNASKAIEINGKSYQTIEIGNQIWTASNYAGQGGVPTQDVKYGKLYTYEEANAIPLPLEWRLPTAEDYNSLMLSLGATKNQYGLVNANSSTTQKLMSNTGWNHINGNNSSGFSATPTGYNTPSGSYEAGETFRAWTTSSIRSGNDTYQYIFDLSTDSDKDAWAGLGDDTFTGYKLSIRFVRNK